jgi:hypothetical protein
MAGQPPKIDVRAWLETTFGAERIVKCYVAHEFGKVRGDEDSEPYAHTHYYVEFNDNLNIRNDHALCKFRYPLSDPSYRGKGYSVCNECGNGIWSNVTFITKNNDRSKLKALQYMAKQDSECAIEVDADVKELRGTTGAKGMTVAEIVTNRTQQEVLSMCVNPSHVGGLLMAHKILNRSEPMNGLITNPFKWQISAIELIQNMEATRHVVWFYSPLGNMGMSTLARHMLIVLGSNRVYLTKTACAEYHMATIIRGALESGCSCEYTLFDLPRGACSKDVYTSIECLKDGCITAQKYAGGTIFFAQSKVVVFANWLPNVRKLSSDRWKIFELVDREKDPVVVPYAEAFERWKTQMQDMGRNRDEEEGEFFAPPVDISRQNNNSVPKM